jgi:hypothetical protein
MASFETRDLHSHERLRPLRVAMAREALFEEARIMVGDLPAWRLIEADPAGLRLLCLRDGGWLRGKARITLQIEGPAGIPSASLIVRSETNGALLPRDRANVLEFMQPFHRRVC